MNKYIKKCLIIYTSLALVLVGMAGVAYAITASDANKYVTRSRYATDMSHIQNKLDQQEAGLLGNISRYRSTDVFFSTWDSPELQDLENNYRGGYFNGGNYFPRKKSHNSWTNNVGPVDTINNRMDGMYENLRIYRLWNGNYYVTNDISYRDTIDASASGQGWFPTVLCAVPLENHKGWYALLASYQSYSTYTHYYFSVVKLDPNIPYNDTEISDIYNNWNRLRLKKEYWQYAGVNTTPITTTRQAYTYNSTSYYTNNFYITPFMQSYYTGASSTGSHATNWATYLDQDTGDYIVEFKNIYPCCPAYGERTYNENAVTYLSRFIVRDNVEYLMGPVGYYQTRPGYYYVSNPGNWVGTLPDTRYIGTGQYNDNYYEYEFVDCVNGLKYWHCRRRSTDVKPNSNSANPSALAHNYSIPIVY